MHIKKKGSGTTNAPWLSREEKLKADEALVTTCGMALLV